jgi:hypothetical protein
MCRIGFLLFLVDNFEAASKLVANCASHQSEIIQIKLISIATVSLTVRGVRMKWVGNAHRDYLKGYCEKDNRVPRGVIFLGGTYD